MNHFKIAAAIFIIVSGLIGSYLIVKNSKPIIDIEKEKGVVEKIISETLPENPIQWIGKNNEFDKVANSNLTQSLAEGIFEEVKSANINERLISGNLSTANVIKRAQLDLKLVSDIPDVELKISQDNSKEARIQYLKTLSDITKKNWRDFSKIYLEVIVDVYQKLNSSPAVQLAEIYKNFANDYLDTAVPADWVDTHKAAIIYFKNAEIVYRAMAAYPTDPIKGYLALEMIEGIIQRGEQVQSSFKERAQEAQLTTTKGNF